MNRAMMLILLVAFAIQTHVACSQTTPYVFLSSVLLLTSPILGDLSPWDTTNQANPDRSKEWVETCDTHMTQIKVSYPGCISKSMITYACKGTCYSRSIAKWKPDVEDITMVHHCMCCKPMRKRFRVVTLECPSHGKSKPIMVSAAMECRCRPCSDGQPEQQQPYDY